MTVAVRETLNRLAAGDQRALTWAEASAPDSSGGAPAAGLMLDPPVRALVALGALLADDGPAASISWLAQRATCFGVTPDELVAVLAIVAREAGSSSVADLAARLALALDYEPGPGAD
jgi:alkylhydroperoxidase/carboxymuconolactone decarboxylase family protein YurZ